MALTVKEAEAFLADLKLSDDERKQMETILGSDERQNVIKSGVHAKAEADRLMTLAKQAKEEAEASQTNANNQVTAWKAWYDENEPLASQYLSERDEAVRKSQMLSKFLFDQGIDPAGVVPAATTPPPAPEAFSWEKAMADPKFTAQFIPREEAMKTANDIMAINDIQYRLSVKHQNLTGKPIEDWSALRAEAVAAKQPLETYVSGKFEYGKIEQDRADKALEDRANKMAEERYAALISRTGLPQPTADTGETAVFSNDFAAKGPYDESAADRAAVERAMAFQNANPNHAADVGDMNI